MGKNQSVTPKATLTLNGLGPGFNLDNVSAGATNTLKFKRDKLATSLAYSDNTLRNVKSLRDVVATVDYKVPRGVTLNGKYELGTKKYTAGATLDSTIANKASTLKLFYTNKDKLIAGEGTVNLQKNQKANVTFNQKQLLTAKYTYTKGDMAIEPSYHFGRQAPALAVTKKIGAKDSLKLSYDLKSEGAAAEWVRKPFKVVLSSKVSRSLSVTKPTLAATFENIYEF